MVCVGAGAGGDGLRAGGRENNDGDDDGVVGGWFAFIIMGAAIMSGRFGALVSFPVVFGRSARRRDRQ
jgi:hypothetical protein